MSSFRSVKILNGLKKYTEGSLKREFICLNSIVNINNPKKSIISSCSCFIDIHSSVSFSTSANAC